MTPEALLDAFWQALRQGEWVQAASMVLSDEAARRQDEELATISSCFQVIDQGAGATPSALVIVSDPDHPSPPQWPRYRERRVSTFPGSPTLGELAALTPGAFLARAMAAVAGPARRGRPGSDRRPFPLSLGVVYEREDLAHLLFRIEHPEEEPGVRAVRLVSFGREAGAWRLYLEHELGMAFSPGPPWPDRPANPEAPGQAAV
jgi:hypothetical protein